MQEPRVLDTPAAAVGTPSPRRDWPVGNAGGWLGWDLEARHTPAGSDLTAQGARRAGEWRGSAQLSPQTTSGAACPITSRGRPRQNLSFSCSLPWSVGPSRGDHNSRRLPSATTKYSRHLLRAYRAGSGWGQAGSI